MVNTRSLAASLSSPTSRPTGKGQDAALSSVVISGDFFLEPAEALLAINSQLVGMPASTPVAELAAVVARAAGPDAQFIGFSPESVAIAVRRALGHATGWHDHTFELIHDEPREPHLQMALDEVLAQEVGAGRRGPALRIWEWERNTVVIGSFQSMRNEIDSEGAARHDVTVTRRVSGGGAMFIQPGNTITYSLYVPTSLVEGLVFRAVVRVPRRLGARRAAWAGDPGHVRAAQRHRLARRQDRGRRAEALHRGSRAPPRHDGVRHRRRRDARGVAHRPREALGQGNQERQQARGSRCGARRG